MGPEVLAHVLSLWKNHRLLHSLFMNSFIPQALVKHLMQDTVLEEASVNRTDKNLCLGEKEEEQKKKNSFRINQQIKYL